ncbi:MAG: archaeal ADP-dependent phosphofructokinase/glucokinase [Candidatus Nanosalina sp. J07AB43]|nr:MAG: archaeal ADP-dependent phosphofructokinase/glucokinase [Candidatus Nanosalina sp. J07AB43]
MLDGKIVLKRATECTNSDRTKKDAVIKLNNGNNYLKLSGKMQGFGPYFRSGVEENFSHLDKEMDRIILSGFQETEGNYESKLIKSSQQLEKIETEKHLEYVTMSQEKRQLMIEEVIPKFESISLDEAGAKELAEELEIQVENRLSAEDALKLGKALLDIEEIKRCHIQTYRYQICVTSADYRIEASKIRDAMLYAQIYSTAMAETGSIPEEEDVQKSGLDGRHVHRLDPLEDMADHLDKERFVETGVYSGSEIKAAAIPTLIEEDPKRVDGLRTVSSSGAFTEEIR